VSNISSEKVRAEVTRYWTAFTGKSADIMASMYAPYAMVFPTWATRPEPARLTVARRQREYFNPKTSITGYPGEIEVTLQDTTAVAVYTYQLHIVNSETGPRGTESHTLNGRATQVFALDHEGKLKIVHEHLSVARK
jgi:ketosteroid isomerase-like protein